MHTNIGGADTYYSTGTIPVNQWTHITITSDGTTKRVYFNGAFDSSGGTATVENNPRTTLIGANPTPGQPSFQGRIDEVRIWNRALDASEIPQPDSDRWSIEAPMPTVRGFLGGAAVNDVIYAIGGIGNAPPYYLATNEAYDPATNTWSTKAPMPTARGNMPAVAVNGVIHVIGGHNNSSYVATHEAYHP